MVDLRVVSIDFGHQKDEIGLQRKRMENDDGDLGAVVRATYSASGAPSTLPMMIRATGAYGICELPLMDQDASSFNENVNKVGFSSPPNLVSWCNSTQVVNLPTFLSNTDMGLEKKASRTGSDPFYNGNLLSFSSSVFDSLVGHENTMQLQPSILFSSTISDKKPSENDQGGKIDYGFANAATEAPAALNRREIGMRNGSQNDQILSEKKSCNTSSIHDESKSDVPSKILQYSPPTRAEPSADPSGDRSSSPAKHSIVGSAITDRTGSSKGQGIKRRKTQQKRIICVPAAGGSNRPSGEGVPSDLWAWRKYGQKPIKGSPYPRGYYRCSSSKGCSARKQVERSRTDPSMLVITYTSDHNHPWPTQRNALAGTTRQSAANLEKNSIGSSDKEEFHGKVDRENSSDAQKNHDTVNAFSSIANPSNPPTPHVGSPGQEMFHDQEKAEVEAGLHLFRSDILRHNDDFFADLGELPEPFNIFARHFTDEADQSDDEADSTAMDPFNLFNWSSSTFNHVESKTAR